MHASYATHMRACSGVHEVSVTEFLGELVREYSQAIDLGGRMNVVSKEASVLACTIRLIMHAVTPGF
jgi:hypothetical protein